MQPLASLEETLCGFTLCRLRVRVIGLAGTSGMDKENGLDHNMANTSDIHVYDTGLRKTTIQKLVSGYISHVYHLDWIFKLRCRLDDYNNR